jgi:hypothetical protein
MKLKKFLKAADSRVCGGSEYQWDCFGRNAQYMDISDLSGEEIGGCIFDRETQVVYQVELYVNSDNVAYRWLEPEWACEYGLEADRRKVDKMIAYDDVRFTEVYSEEDILDLTHRIVHNTYVHSKPIDGIGPAAAWPFPPMGNKQFVGQANFDTDPPTAEEMAESWNDDDEDGFDVDEFRSMAGVESEDEPAQEEYEVMLTVKHRFTVKARNMEAACDKAKEFQQNMKSGGWPEGLCWEDRWVSKVGASKRLETLNIED